MMIKGQRVKLVTDVHEYGLSKGQYGTVNERVGGSHFDGENLKFVDVNFDGVGNRIVEVWEVEHV